MSTSLLALAGVAKAAIHSGCIICEHIGFAATEQDALNVLNADGTGGTNYCVNGGTETVSVAEFEGDATTAANTPSYCVAQFFIYKAKDMAADSTTSNKAYVVLQLTKEKLNPF